MHNRPRLARYLAWLTAIILTACSHFGRAPDTSMQEHYKQSPQFKKGRFSNHLPMNPDITLLKFLGVMRQWNANLAHTIPQQPLPLTHLDPNHFSQPATDQLQVWWLGHSTAILEVDGLRILVDPVWSERTFAWQFMGPKRFYPPLLALEDLPHLDAILISHDHYDHLDAATIKWLNQHTTAPFYMPLGVSSHLKHWGVPSERMTELDWWQSAVLTTQSGSLELACTPSRHMSGRKGTDTYKTLWASWSIIGPRHRVFFGGDSGLFQGFEDIGNRYGPFDLTMLDTGQYGTLWPDVHMGPEQAVIAHKALRGRILLPIHWALFKLSVHAWTEPAERIRIAARNSGVQIIQPEPGTGVNITKILPMDWHLPDPWWPKQPVKTASQTPISSTTLDPAWLETWR